MFGKFLCKIHPIIIGRFGNGRFRHMFEIQFRASKNNARILQGSVLFKIHIQVMIADCIDSISYFGITTPENFPQYHILL